jgi:DNA-binding HxlR family transcriptional regulator
MRNKQHAAQLPPNELFVKQPVANPLAATALNSPTDAAVDDPPASATTSDNSPLALDRLIHERLRLGIISALAANQALTFNELKTLLKTTDGNLSVHARKLEEANYITCKKYFDGRVPKTEYQLTNEGRAALERYLSHMEALITAMREHG